MAGSFSYSGKEIKRKLEQRPVDHELYVRGKAYQNGRVAADLETPRLLKQFSERASPDLFPASPLSIIRLLISGIVQQSAAP